MVKAANSRGTAPGTPPRTRILIVGGGYVGMYTALRLQRKLRAGEAEVTVVSAEPYMTYQPFLPEAAAGAISPATSSSRCAASSASAASSSARPSASITPNGP